MFNFLLFLQCIIQLLPGFPCLGSVLCVGFCTNSSNNPRMHYRPTHVHYRSTLASVLLGSIWACCMNSTAKSRKHDFLTSAIWHIAIVWHLLFLALCVRGVDSSCATRVSLVSTLDYVSRLTEAALTLYVNLSILSACSNIHDCVQLLQYLDMIAEVFQKMLFSYAVLIVVICFCFPPNCCVVQGCFTMLPKGA